MKDLKQLIRESINEYIKAIDEAGHKAGMEARMAATQEAIDKRKKMTALDELDEDMKGMIDEKKVKDINAEVKALEKSLAKLQKQLDKLTSKANKGEKAEETPEEIIDEISLGENEDEERYDEERNVDPNGMYDAGANYIGAADTAIDKAEYDKDTMNESFLYMQKMAGIISETEYKAKVEEARFKKGTDIGKKGKGFAKIAKSAAKEYGSKEAGKRVAGAILKKVIKKEK